MNITQSARASASADNDLIDLRGLLGAFRKRLGVFFASFLLVFTIVSVVTFQITPKYTSTASVMLDLRQKDVADIEAVVSGLPPDSATVDTEVELIKSRALTRKVVDELDLVNDPEFNAELREPSGFKSWVSGLRNSLSLVRPSQVADELSDIEAERLILEKVVEAVQHRLTVRRSGLTYVIDISFESENPRKASEIVNAFADQYLVDQLEAKYEATSRANSWLNERLEGLREDVRATENAVEVYRAQSGLLSAEGSSLTEQQISDLTAQLVIQRAELDEAEARLRSVQSQVDRGASADSIGEVLNSDVIRDLRAQQANVARRRADLSSRYGPRHPEILRVEREAADIQTQIDQEVRRIVAGLENEVNVARQRVESLQTSLGGLRGELSQNNQSLVRLRELERDAEANRSLYESFLNRFKETGQQESLNEADARIVSPGAVPTTMSSPNTMLNLALGLVLGGIFGVGVIFLLEMLDSGLTSGAQVENELGLPFIASVPIPNAGRGVVGAVRKIAGSGLQPQDYLVKKPLSSFTEAYRALRSSIVLSNVDTQQQVVAITSALPGDGKTTSTFCLGRLSAMSGARTIIVDCDLRRRFLSKSMLPGGIAQKGLLQYLAGECELNEVITKDDKTDCDILPLAKSNYTPSDVFGSRAFAQLLQGLRQRYDLIILDTAPVLPVAETRTIAHLSDTVVVCAKWRSTKKGAVEAAINILADVGARLSGVLLTQVNPHSRAKYGYGDYGYYYSSYRKYYVE